MRQTIKNAVVFATAIAATATVMQVASASFLPQSAVDKELQQSASVISAPVGEPLQIKPEDLAVSTSTQDQLSSESVSSDDLAALIDMQTQPAFGTLPSMPESSPVEPFRKADNTLARPKHLAALEQPGDVSAYAPDQDVGPARDGVRQPPRDTNRSLPRQRGSQISRIEFDAPALAPVSHTIFCLKYREECKVDKSVSAESRMTLTSERWAEAERVNAAVNRAIIPHPNTKGLAGEVWLISPRAGECHDYAVTKRHELMALGWPEQDLLLSEVVTSWGEHHLVLVLRTSEGDFVADNLSPTIRVWSQTPYQWVRIQSPGNPLIWSTLANPTVAARARTRTSGQADPS